MPRLLGWPRVLGRLLRRLLLSSWAIAGLSGIGMALAPAPLNAWFLAWIALIPLWVMVQQSSGKIWRGLLLGLAWGIGYHGFTLVWILGLHPLTWMGVPWLASVAIALGCWIFVSLWGAAIGGLWGAGLAWLAPHQSPLQRSLTGTALWCGLEWLWSQSPLWWNSLSYTQSPANLLILHLGQLAGPLTVTAILVAVNGLLAEALLQTRRGWPYLAAALVLGISGHLLGASLAARPLVQPPEMALKIGIVQGNIPTRIKLSAAGVRQALSHYSQGYRQLAQQGVDGVLLPEGAMPVRWSQPQVRSNPLFQAIVQQRVLVWLGTFVPQEGGITQSLLTLTGTGETFSRYDKIKLVPLGEYIPFEPTLGRLIARLSPLETGMVPGVAHQKFATPLGTAIAGICYDSVFPQLFRAQAAAGGEFILTAANLDPYNRVMMAQNHAQEVMRAIESDRWLVRATNTGYSAIVDPHGQTHWLSPAHTFTIHAGTIYRRQHLTLYVRWGNWLTPLLGVLACLWGLGAAGRDRGQGNSRF